MWYDGWFGNCNMPQASTDFQHHVNCPQSPYYADFSRSMNWTNPHNEQEARFFRYNHRNNFYSSGCEFHYPHYSNPCVPDQTVSSRNQNKKVDPPNVNPKETISLRNSTFPFTNAPRAQVPYNIRLDRNMNYRSKGLLPHPGTFRINTPTISNTPSVRPNLFTRNPVYTQMGPHNQLYSVKDFCNVPRQPQNLLSNSENNMALLMPCGSRSVGKETWRTSNSSSIMNLQSTGGVEYSDKASEKQSDIRNKEDLMTGCRDEAASVLNTLEERRTFYPPMKYLISDTQKIKGVSHRSKSDFPRTYSNQRSKNDIANDTFSEQKSGQKNIGQLHVLNFHTENNISSHIPLSKGVPQSSWHCPTLYLENEPREEVSSKASETAVDQVICSTLNNYDNSKISSKLYVNIKEIGEKGENATKSNLLVLNGTKNRNAEQAGKLDSCNLSAGKCINARINEKPLISNHLWNKACNNISGCDSDEISKTEYSYQGELRQSVNRSCILEEGILNNDILEKSLSDVVQDIEVVDEEIFPQDPSLLKVLKVPLVIPEEERIPNEIRNARLADIEKNSTLSFSYKEKRKMMENPDKKSQNESGRLRKIPKDSVFYSNLFTEFNSGDELHSKQGIGNEGTLRTSNANHTESLNEEVVSPDPIPSSQRTNNLCSEIRFSSPVCNGEIANCNDVKAKLDNPDIFTTRVSSHSIQDKVGKPNYPIRDLGLENSNVMEAVDEDMKNGLLFSSRLESKVVEDGCFLQNLAHTEENTIKEKRKPKNSMTPAPSYRTEDIAGEELLSSEDLELANCENIDVEEIRLSDEVLKETPRVEKKVVDRCPRGHFLNPCLASFNLKTGRIVVPCKKCKCLIFMESRINLL